MKDNLHIEIERYLDGTLTPDETDRFLEELRRDPEGLARLGLILEDQAHLFDALREASPAPARLRATRAFRGRRTGSRPATGSRGNLAWVLGLAAAGIFVVVLGQAFSGAASRARTADSDRGMAQHPPPAPPPGRSEDPAVPRDVPPPAPSARPDPRPEPRFPKAVPPAPIAPKAPAPLAAPPTPAPEPPRGPAGDTRVAMAVLEEVKGDCVLLEGSATFPAKSQGPLLSGQGLRCGAEGATIRFPDGSRVELGPGTTVREIVRGPDGRQIALETGTLAAQVTRLIPPEKFSVTTAQARIVVVGTRFSVACAGESTRIDVREGRVAVTRLSDGAAVEVPAKHSAVAGPGAPPVALPFPVDEILLLPAQGRIAGPDWHLEKDPQASTGVALEAPKGRSGSLQDAPSVIFTEVADAGKTYSVWVRGLCLARTNRVAHDAVVVDFGDAEVTEPPGPNKGLGGGPSRALFNGFMYTPGYGWVGSDSDQGRDAPCVTVRFARPGRQTLKLYAREGPIRIDAVWISATQKTRPDDSQVGPPAVGK